MITGDHNLPRLTAADPAPRMWTATLAMALCVVALVAAATAIAYSPSVLGVAVTVVDGDMEIPVTTRARYVEDVLKAAGIELGPLDRVDTGLLATVANGMTVRVIRVKEVEEIVEKAIPFETRHKLDRNLTKGQTRIVQSGVEGLKRQTVLVRYENSKPVDRRVISEVVVRPPQAKIVAHGTKEEPKILKTSAGIFRYDKVLVMEATAYEPGPRSCGIHADGITAIGIKAEPGVVAVDPKVIPLRTKLFIEGYGPAIAADTGSAIKGMRIDLCFNTVEEALQYGRRKVKVYILSEGQDVKWQRTSDV